MNNITIEFGMTKATMAQACVAGLKVDEIIDKPVKLIGHGSYVDGILNNETGEVEQRVVNVFAVEDGGARQVVSSPSPTLSDAYDTISDLYEDEKKDLTVVFTHGKSNAGRKFLTMYPAE